MLQVDLNCWKELYKGYKCFQLAKNSRKCPEVVESVWEIDQNLQKLLEMAWPENVILNTSVMCRVMQLLLWPEQCQGV